MDTVWPKSKIACSLRLFFQRLHLQSLVALHAWADICTGATSCTVKCRDGHGKLVAWHTGHILHLHICRSVSSFISCHSYRTDNSVRTYIGTEVTLDTVVNIPYRNIYCNTTLLVCGRTRWCSTVYIILECGYRQGVSFLSAYLGLDIVYEINNFLAALGNYLIIKAFVLALRPACRNLYLVNALSAASIAAQFFITTSSPLRP